MTHAANAKAMYMRVMASARSTGSSSGPMPEALQSFATTKSIVI